MPQTSVILDGVIVVILALFLLMGIKKGFFRTLADLVLVFVDIECDIADHRAFKADGEKHMLRAFMKRRPFLNSSLNGRIIGIMRCVVKMHGRLIEVGPNLLNAFPVVRSNAANGKPFCI